MALKLSRSPRIVRAFCMNIGVYDNHYSVCKSGGKHIVGYAELLCVCDRDFGGQRDAHFV